MNMIVSLMASGAKKRFSRREYRQIRREADALFRKLTEENGDLPKAMKRHTGTNIFPAIAVYAANTGYRARTCLSMPGISFSWLFCRLFSETGNGSEYLAQAKACLKAVSMSIWSSTGTRKWHGRKPCDTGA